MKRGTPFLVAFLVLGLFGTLATTLTMSSTPAVIAGPGRTMSGSQSVSIVVPPNASGWYIKYKVLYPNASVALGTYSEMSAGSLPTVNVTVTPSATSGTGNKTITFNITVSTNLKFGEVPVTVVVYEYLNGTNALYSTQVLHFRFFVVPPNSQDMFVGAPRFANFTTVGHARFGNVSIMNANMPADIISVVKGSDSVQILFNNSFMGMISFQSNVTPTAIYADGQELQRAYYTVLSNMPLGTWTEIGNTVYVYADPANVTVVYGNPTTTSPSGHLHSAQQFYDNHKLLVVGSVSFVFFIIIVAALVLLRR
jgi:hypothetical protein